MDGHVVGVAFNPDRAGVLAQDVGDAGEGGLGARLDGGRAAVEETDLAQADHQAIGFHVQRDLIARDFGSQRLLQFGCEWR